jgi:predicted secreted acid phosphatase
MFKAIFATLIIAIAQTAFSPAFAECNCDAIPKPPHRSPETMTRSEGLAWSYTAAYRKEFDTAIAGATKAIKENIGKPNVAVVSDIDETLLDNREEFKRHPDFNSAEFKAWIDVAKAPVLPKTYKLLTWARRKGFAVFLITGRDESQRKSTIQNLVRNNIGYDGLMMRADDDDGRAEISKTKHRETIEKMGFNIILNIGDQWSDLYGGHSAHCEKLPNKIYYID